jgi:hypothetical protein
VYIYPLPSQRNIEFAFQQLTFQQLIYHDVYTLLCTNFNTTTRWFYEQNRAVIDLQTQLHQERTANYRDRTALLRKVEFLESRIATMDGKGKGKVEMEERSAQARGPEDSPTPSSRWLMQNVRESREDTLPAWEQKPDVSGSRSPLPVILEERRSSAEIATSDVQQSDQTRPRRASKRSRTAI